MEDADDEYEPSESILDYLKGIVLAPFRIATSPTLLRTYLRTVLFLITSFILFGVAVTAYTSLYYAYVPVRGLYVPIYLQYDHAAPLPPTTTSSHLPRPADPRSPKHPYGIANVAGIASRQKYDVLVDLRLPRSERNLHAGNWMIGLELRGPHTRGGGVKGALGWQDDWAVEDFSQGEKAGVERDGLSSEEAGAGVQKRVVLARSRRPGILTYRSGMTEFAYRVLRLPWYVVGWGEESERVSVGMMEGVEFERGWRNVPDSVKVEVRARQPLEVYSVGVRFVARLEGLRWAMHTHRLASAAMFIGAFWGMEMVVVLITWAAIALCFPGEEERDDGGRRRVKLEEDESEVGTPAFSDTDRTFPTLPSQRPLHYTSPKEEEKEPELGDVPVKEEAEADDEEDDYFLEEPIPNTAAGVLTDSGIGTSMESSVERRGLTRRRSGGLGDKS